jgi:hypothetical protein
MPTTTARPVFRSVSRSVLARLGLAVLAGAATATAGATAHAALPGLSCKPVSVKGTGFQVQKLVARRIARIDWADKAAAAFGQSWASWSRAASRRVACTHNPSPSQHGWYCVVRGRPCRYRNPGVTPYRYRAPHPARPGLQRRRRELRRQYRQQ